MKGKPEQLLPCSGLSSAKRKRVFKCPAQPSRPHHKKPLHPARMSCQLAHQRLPRTAPQPAPKKSSPTRKLIIGAVALVALAVAAKYGYDYATVGRFMVSTDDAYVKADTSVLSTKVAGLVTETPVLNNTPVKAGTVLLRLDTKDYELAIADAKAKIATQQAAHCRHWQAEDGPGSADRLRPGPGPGRPKLASSMRFSPSNAPARW